MFSAKDKIADAMVEAIRAREWNTRDKVVPAYRALIMICEHEEDWNAGSVNAAIIERWSKSGLEYIKREAWK